MWTAPSAGVLEYQLKIRCLHEFAAPAFHGALTQQQSNEIEMMQKKAFSVIFGTDYRSFSNALKAQDELKTRRLMLCTSFAVKCTKHPRHSHLFKSNQRYSVNSRSKNKFTAPKSKTIRYYRSAVPYLTRVLNSKQ